MADLTSPPSPAGAGTISRRVGIWDVFERIRSSPTSPALGLVSNPAVKINHSILSRLQRLLEWPAHLAKHLRQRLRSSRALELDAKRDQPQPKRNQRQPALSLASVWPPGPRLILHLVLDQPRFFTVYIIAELATAALPCISLWVTTWVFRAWSSALDPHMGNVNPMVLVIVTKTLLRASVLLVRGVSLCAERELRHHLNGHIFVRNIKARARLDLPTSNKVAVASLFSTADDLAQDGAWNFLRAAIGILVNTLAFGTTSWLVADVLWTRSGFTLLMLSVLVQAAPSAFALYCSRDDAEWWAVCEDQSYLKLLAFHRTVLDSESKYRQDIVAGNMQRAIEAECDRLARKVGERALFDFTPIERDEERWQRSFFGLGRMRDVIVNELPHIALAYIATTGSVGSLPFMMSSFSAVQEALQRFSGSLGAVTFASKQFVDQLERINSFIALSKLENEVEDGTLPFPEDPRVTAAHGIAIEFDAVSFTYPGLTEPALREVSFRIDRGQLAVFVGKNGAGKSTILKLLARLYEPDNGRILVDGLDISTLRLEDLRQTLAVMFQTSGSSILPLSLRDNIAGICSPEHAPSDEELEAVAKLAGIDFFNEERGLDTYLSHPVHLYGSADSIPTNTPQDIKLSGGEAQKIAYARLLQRVTSADDRVGLMLLDEPSAEMDPIARSGLIATLLRVRGGKTMIFSSHDYGHLTREADVIFYMQDGRIVERGTHDELLAMNNDYSRMWKVQASGFQPKE